MICRKCGHASGMHDDGGCMALNCVCDRYIPTSTNVTPFVQPPRGPLNYGRHDRQPRISSSGRPQKGQS